MKRELIILLLCAGLSGHLSLKSAPLHIVSYNVENLFHPAHDSLKNDIEWTVNGERHWSYTRYYKKVENIARVLR